MPIVVCELNGMYYKYAYFIFIITVFIFSSLLLGISTCYSTREQFYLSGITSLFFYPLFFLRTKRFTSQHNL